MARRARAERAIRIAARDLLAAHGTEYVQVELTPDDDTRIVAAGSRALARVGGIGADSLSDHTVQQLARAMTRLGVTTNYRPAVFREDFEGNILALCAALHRAMDDAWAIPSAESPAAPFDGGPG